MQQVETASTLAEAGRQAAIKTAEGFCRDWGDKALEYIKAFPFVEFMTEELRCWAHGAGLPRPVDSRAWGGVMKRAAKAGVITRLRYDETRGKSAHGTVCTVWTKDVSKVRAAGATQQHSQAAFAEALAIVQALATWSAKYPRSGIYNAHTQPIVDGALIAIEERARRFFEDPLRLQAVAMGSFGQGQGKDTGAQSIARAVAEYAALRVNTGTLGNDYASFLLRELFHVDDLPAAAKACPAMRLLEPQDHDGDAK